MFNLPEISNTLDKISYNHRNKYRNLYIRLINKCFTMTESELGGYNEKHHILPKCMGGNNDRSNLIILPIRYHIMAHIVLLEAYPDNIGLAFAVHMMMNGSLSEDIVMSNRTTEINRRFSTRFIAIVRENAIKLMSGNNSKFLGGNNPNSKVVISPDGVIYGSIKEASKDKNIPYMTLTKWLAGETSSHGWSYYKCSKVDYNKLNRNIEKSCKKVKGPDLKVYSSISEASSITGIPYTTLRYWLSGRTKDNHGWNYQL